MPPTSLPAEAVMKPGPSRPMTSSALRTKRERRPSAGRSTTPSCSACCNGSLLVVARETRQRVCELLGKDRVDRVVDRDDAENAVFFVDDRNGQQVVARDRRGDLLRADVGRDADDVDIHELMNEGRRQGEQQAAD